MVGIRLPRLPLFSMLFGENPPEYRVNANTHLSRRRALFLKSWHLDLPPSLVLCSVVLHVHGLQAKWPPKGVSTLS
jgi:hypothetical protein